MSPSAEGAHQSPQDVAALQTKTATKTAESLGGRKGFGAPVRREFVLSPQKSGQPSPLVQIISSGKTPGGPGGKIRLALYLSLLWKAGASSPHLTRGTPRWWAELIGIPDPGQAGARKVRNAWRDLELRGLVALPQRRDGSQRQATDTIELLKEDASRTPYGGAPTSHYFRVPENFWTTGLVARLTSPGLTMFLCVLSLARWHEGAQRSTPVSFSAETAKSLFGVSPSTRQRGLRELVEQGVLVDITDPEEAAHDPRLAKNAVHTYEITPLWAPVTKTKPALPTPPPRLPQ